MACLLQSVLQRASLWTLQTKIAVKNDPWRPQIVLCDVLNVKFLSRHSCLAAACQSRSHSLTVCALGVLLLCCQSLQFLETNISQGSVATPLIFGWIYNDRFNANFLPSVTVKKTSKIDQYLANMWTRVWCLVFLTHGVVQYRRTMINTDHVCLPLQLAIAT